MHAAYAYYLSKFTEFVDTVNFLYFGTKISSKLWGQFILLYLQSLFLFSSPSSPAKNSTTFPSFMWFTTGWCRSVSGRAWGFFPEATRLFSPSPTRSSTSSCTSTTCSRHWDQSKLSFPPFFLSPPVAFKVLMGQQCFCTQITTISNRELLIHQALDSTTIFSN